MKPLNGSGAAGPCRPKAFPALKRNNDNINTQTLIARQMPKGVTAMAKGPEPHAWTMRLQTMHSFANTEPHAENNKRPNQHNFQPLATMLPGGPPPLVKRRAIRILNWVRRILTSVTSSLTLVRIVKGPLLVPSSRTRQGNMCWSEAAWSPRLTSSRPSCSRGKGSEDFEGGCCLFLRV